MWRITIRDIRTHWGRFALTALAVILGVTFLTGTLMLRNVLNDVFDKVIANQYHEDVYVVGPPAQGQETSGEGKREQVDATLATELEALPEVAYADPAQATIGVLTDRRELPVTVGRAPTIIIPLQGHKADPKLVAGRLPSAEAEVAIGQNLITPNLQLGDTVKLVLGGKAQDVKIVGTVDVGASTGGAAVVFLSADAFAPYRTDQVPNIAIGPASGYDVNQVKKAIEGRFPDLVVLDQAQIVDESSKSVQRILGFINTFLVVFVVIALFVGAFIIANTFRMSVHARQREFALLRAIGASSTDVFGVVIGQAIIVGLVGSVLGIASGWGLIQAYQVAMDKLNMKFLGEIPLTREVALISLAVGIGVTLIGAILPARAAALTAPVEAMRDSDSAARGRMAPRALGGLVLIAVGTGAIVYANTHRDWDFSGWALGLGAGSVVAGVLLGAAAFVIPIVWALSAPLRIFRPHGRLAMRNIMRNHRRTAATASALVIGMALVGAGAVLATSAKESSRALVAQELKADLVFAGMYELPLDPALVSDLEKIDGVERLDASLTSKAVRVTLGPSKKYTVKVMRVDPQQLRDMFEVGFAEGSLAAYGPDKVMVKRNWANENHVTLGQELTLGEGAEARIVEVCAVIESNILQAEILATSQTWKDIARAQTRASAAAPAAAGQAAPSQPPAPGQPAPGQPAAGQTPAPGQPAAGQAVPGQAVPPQPGQEMAEPLANWAPIKVKPGVSVAAVKERIEERIKGLSYMYQVHDKESLTNEIATQVDQMLAVVYSLLALSIFIAILGIVNTLSLSVSQRVRELAVIRAVGMQRPGVGGMVVIESILTALFGGIVGVFTGVGIAAGVQRYAAEQGLSELVIPWAQLASFGVVMVIAGVLAAIVPAIRAARKPILAGIASE